MRYPDITSDMVKDFEDSLSFKLRVPDNAKTAKVKDKRSGEVVAHKRWRETAQIDAVEVETTESNAGDEHDEYRVTFSITGTKGSGLNVGKKVFLRSRTNMDAYRPGNETDGQYIMTKFTLAKLTQLVSSAGFPVSGGLSSAQFAAYFPENDESPLVGKEVEIQCDQSEDENSPSGFRDQVNNVFPMRVTEANVEV